MEYFIGSIATLIAFVTLSKLFNKYNATKKPDFAVRYSQSYVHEMLNSGISIVPIQPPMVTQARKHLETRQTRVVFANNKAYWISNNTCLEADVVDGEVQQDTQRAVDTMSLDKVQLDEMSFIVSKLTEGTTNDFGNSGNKEI